MKNLTNILENLTVYLYSARGAGHTRVMMEGAKSEPAFVVTHTHDWGEKLRRLNRSLIVVPLGQLGSTPGVLSGTRLPLVIDNGALMQIFDRCLWGIKEAPEREIDQVKKQLGEEQAAKRRLMQENTGLKSMLVALTQNLKEEETDE